MNGIESAQGGREGGHCLARRAAIMFVVLLASVVPGCGPAEPPATVATEAGPAKDSGQETAGPIDEILGAWEADLEHNGQRGRFAVEFVRHDSGAVIAKMSIPQLDVWSLPAWQVTMEGDEIQMGSTVLAYDAAAGTLTGVMPDSMVPVHRIPLVLKRVASIDRPPVAEKNLPAREPVWTFDTGGPIWAGISHADGVVYTGSDDGIVYAIDARSGKESWRFSSQGAIRARPLLDGRFLLVHSDDGYLYRLDAGSGSIDWRARLGPPLQRIEFDGEGYRYDGYASGPAVADGIIYLSHAEGRLLAVDASTGEEHWEFRAGDQIASTPLVRDGRVYFGSFDGQIRAIHAQSGTLLWEHPAGAEVSSSAAWHEGKVIIGSRSYDLLALNAGDGSVAWNYYYWFSWIESTAAVMNGIAYIGSSDSQLLNTIDATTGRLLWTFDTGGSAWGEPAVGDETVYIGAVGVAEYMVEHHGGFYAVDRATGRGLWHFPSERPGEDKLWGFSASPAVADDLIFAGGLDGKVYAFSASQ